MALQVTDAFQGNFVASLTFTEDLAYCTRVVHLDMAFIRTGNHWRLTWNETRSDASARIAIEGDRGPLALIAAIWAHEGTASI
jgi:hypothetical protein